MIAVLSGGTGTPKLLRGLKCLLDDGEIAVIVNTAEDMWLPGGHMSPDIDTVMYLFAGILNTETWWGIRGDTFTTHHEVVKLGIDEYIAIGDRDRAVHIARADLLRSGKTLTETTQILCSGLGVRASVLPMTDSEVTTMIRTDEGFIHFQEYWVKHRGDLAIREAARVFRERLVTTPEVLSAIRNADAVIIGPSNPVTSILPILECEGVPEALGEKYVVSVSPFIGDVPVSGPAAALMKARGCEPSSFGTFALYRDLIDLFIQDIRDPALVPGSLRCDTLMTDEMKSIALARVIMDSIQNQA